MPRKLKCWNGPIGRYRDHGYVMAFSQKDAVSLINDAYYSGHISLYYFRGWWSEGWGTRADAEIGDPNRRGVWVWRKDTNMFHERVSHSHPEV